MAWLRFGKIKFYTPSKGSGKIIAYLDGKLVITERGARGDNDGE